MKEIISFLTQLQKNNNRAWFQDNKAWYQDCQARFNLFTKQLIEGIQSFDDEVGPLEVKDCTYRIYRDVRFSPDKSPYKTHFGAYVVRGGKKSGYSGYYFQVGVEDTQALSGNMLATGNYYCEPKVLKTLREDISMDDEGLFLSALKTAKGFTLDDTYSLKRIPRGFEDGMPYSPYLKLKNYCLIKTPSEGYILDENLLEMVLKDFKTTMPFLRFINRAIDYVKTQDE